MKHWNKVLVVAAVICGVAGIATSARLLVTAVHRYSTQKPLVRGAEDYYPDVKGIADHLVTMRTMLHGC